jgi:hypothetical protein
MASRVPIGLARATECDSLARSSSTDRRLATEILIILFVPLLPLGVASTITARSWSGVGGREAGQRTR